VNYLVEGSGQKYGNIFRLRVQLISAKGKEAHLWAKSYEQEIRELKDIFRIQSQVALDITNELKAGIPAREADLMKQVPTNNSLAYDFYLRGKKYDLDMIWDTAIDMFSNAIRQDSMFLLAHLARASLYTLQYFLKNGTIYNSVNWKGFDSLARADLELSLKILPNSREVKFEEADQLYYLDHNYDKALALLDEINDQMPNNPSSLFLRGCILRRMGQWEESLREMQKATLLDPLNNSNYNEIGLTYLSLRRYSLALEFFNKPKILGLTWVNPAYQFLTIIFWKGDVEEALKISGLSRDYLSGWMDLRCNYLYYKRQFEKIIPFADKNEDQNMYLPKTLILAQLYYLNANTYLSRKYADSAIAELSLKVKESPADERYYSALGYAFAYKGEKRKAIENAQTAIKLKPLKSDALQGYEKEKDLANIYILTEEYDLAMNLIERLLTIPGYLSVPQLKIDPAYDKLRTLPRFQKILATEYETKY
jgi:tetratricopeptide (TPR) repeat protein